MEHRDVFIIEAIIDYCDRIQKDLDTPGLTYEDFSSDVDLQDVSAFRILQIGENANSLSDALKNKYPQIPWHQISGFRNVVAHEYGNIEPETLWKTITEDIPKLRDFCLKLIS